MADHVRHQIRDAVITEMKKITAFGDRVYPYMTKPQKTAPYLIVKCGDEDIQPEKSAFGAAGKPILYREMMLELEIHDKSAGDLADRMDNYLVSIESEMADILTTLAVSVWPASITGIDTGEEDERIEKDAAVMTIVYRIGYRTTEGTAQTAVL